MRHRVPGLKAMIWALFHFAESIVLARRLEKDGVAHLHNHFANSAATVGMLASRFNNIPWSLTLHGISETDYPAGLAAGRQNCRGPFCGLCVVVWSGSGDADRAGQRMAQISHRPLRPCSRRNAGKCGQNRNGERTRKQIVCVARLSSEKGHPGLLQAFAGLVRDGHDIELLLVGDGPEKDEILSMVPANNLALGDRRDKMAGRLSEQDTLTAIAGSDILVLPSFMEGLPVVLMEGMALGKPVVASRIAGVPELIDDEHSGLLFHPADWDGLQKALDRTLSDEAAAASKSAETGPSAKYRKTSLTRKLRFLLYRSLYADAMQVSSADSRGGKPT